MKSNTVRDHYNTDIPERAGAAYEFDRWHKTPIAQAGYEMTKKGLSRFLKDFEVRNCFELGPGAGTWTKLLCEKFPGIHIDAFDISSHMLSMAKEQVGDCDVAFIEGDFDTYKKDGNYDLLFSSRVFEYLPRQDVAVENMSRLLVVGGVGIVSTKFPRGKVGSTLHAGRVHPRDFVRMITDSGMRVKGLRPLTLTVPFLKSAFANRMLYMLLGWLPLNPIHYLFCESYVVYFEKYDR